ncbi:hypothetical protein ACBZ91_10610 [Vibrio natriegens]|uniref:hypothetical protein n=1 Tax=Vibrio natriegens TaxID=691 RepID=UPI003558B38D
MTKKGQQTSDASNLPYLEYCSIDMASQLLGVQVELIEHYIEIGAVNPVVKLHRVVESENISFLTDSDKPQKINEGRYSKIRDSGNNDYLLTGLWKVKDLVIVNDILHCLEAGQRAVGLSNLVRFAPIDVKGKSNLAELCTYTVFDDQITRSDLLLLRTDLLAMESAIKKQLPISNIYSDERLSKENVEQLKETQLVVTTKSKIKEAKLIQFALKIYDEFAGREEKNLRIASAAKWAERVLDHHYRVDEWKEEEPLSKDRLTRLLSPHFKAIQDQTRT